VHSDENLLGEPLVLDERHEAQRRLALPTDGKLSSAKVRALTRVATAANEARLLELALYATGAQLERLCRGLRSAQAADEGPAADPCVRKRCRRAGWCGWRLCSRRRRRICCCGRSSGVALSRRATRVGLASPHFSQQLARQAAARASTRVGVVGFARRSHSAGGYGHPPRVPIDLARISHNNLPGRRPRGLALALA
jgi:hypothetical protein